MYIHMHLQMLTYSAGQVGAFIKEMAFHLDPRKAKARVQLISFQWVNGKGNIKIESDRDREKELVCAGE